MTYQDEVQTLSEQATAQVLAVVAAYEAGHINAETATALVAAFVAAANSRAAALADLSLAATLTMALRTPIAPLGITTATDESARLQKAAQTLLAIPSASPGRWQRLATAEAKEAAARAYSTGIRKSRHVTGWTRNLSGSACQLCRWWWREGKVWPADHPMPVHKGCSCSPQPLTR